MLIYFFTVERIIIMQLLFLEVQNDIKKSQKIDLLCRKQQFFLATKSHNLRPRVVFLLANGFRRARNLKLNNPTSVCNKFIAKMLNKGPPKPLYQLWKCASLQSCSSQYVRLLETAGKNNRDFVSIVRHSQWRTAALFGFLLPS